MPARTPCARRRHRRPRSKRWRATRRSRHPFSWSCSGRTCRRAAGCPTRSPPPASGCIAPSGNSAMTVTASLAALSLPAVTPPNLRKSFSLMRGRLAGADDDQPLRLDSLRRRNVERRSALALELVGRRRPLDGVGSLAQRFPARCAEFQRIVTKHHENAAGSRGKSDKADLDGVGHRQILQNSGLLTARNRARTDRILSWQRPRSLGTCVFGTMACKPPRLPSAAVAGRPHRLIINHILRRAMARPFC